jgi:hypothetical protein
MIKTDRRQRLRHSYRKCTRWVRLVDHIDKVNECVSDYCLTSNVQGVLLVCAIPIPKRRDG